MSERFFAFKLFQTNAGRDTLLQQFYQAKLSALNKKRLKQTRVSKLIEAPFCAKISSKNTNVL